MLHHSNAYKSKVICPKIPNKFLSLKGQTGNREGPSFPVKTKEDEQKKCDCDFHITINCKNKKKSTFESIWRSPHEEEGGGELADAGSLRVTPDYPST